MGVAAHEAGHALASMELGLGRPEYSYLVYKLLGDGPIAGARMPPEGEPLTDEEIDRVARWIGAGAPDN